MKKIFTSIFALLGISLLFISCDLLGAIWEELLNPIGEIYLYSLDYGDGTQTLSLFEEDYGQVGYEITFYSDSTSSCEVEFSTSDEKVAYAEYDSATVESKGNFKVYAVGEGTCTITMRAKDYTNKSASIEVTVSAKPLKFKTKSIELDLGNPDKKTATLEYTNTSGKTVSASSSYYSYYARVSSVSTNSLLVTALRTGKTTITIKTTDDKWSDTCNVEIIDSSSASVTITNKNIVSANIDPLEELELQARSDVGNSGISDEISWRSDDPSVVYVNSENGKIKAQKEGKTKIYAYLTKNIGVYDYVEVTVNPVRTPANQFFWGKWTRMDKGTTYAVEETYVLFNEIKYPISSSTDTELVIQGLGSFVKDTENVIKWHDNETNIDVPFYRQGGTNLKYKVRVVGFEDAIAENGSINVSRAAGSESTGKKDLKVKSQSERYSTYKDEGRTDDDGYVELTAPVQGDTQTLTITDDDNEITVVTGLKIENDGDFMGTIPLVKKDEYSLKVTGMISDSAKTNGYLYANNYKSYPLTLTISNISEVESETSVASISCDNPKVSLRIVDSEYNLSSITISSMMPGATKEIHLEVSYGSLSSKYEDIVLDVKVKNLETKRVWVDYVPLRFFAGDMPISIAGKSTENNPNAALNGFVIYPDGNSQFFTVGNNSNRTLYVPIFGNGHKYEIVFSGATVSGNLSKSTEMYYTVAFDSQIPVKVDVNAVEEAYDFGEPNNSETKAFNINKYFADNGIIDKKDFEAYLQKGDIDFYLFETDSSSTTVHN